MIAAGIFITIVLPLWVFVVVDYCHKTPGLGLEDVSIRDMVVYQNTTMATTDTPWQVKSNSLASILTTRSLKWIPSVFPCVFPV